MTVKKRAFSLLAAFVLCLSLIIPASAASIPLMTDDAGLLTANEANSLNGKFEEISDRLNMDVAVVTMDSINGYSAESAVSALYDEYSFGRGEDKDGILLLISMEERDWAIYYNGAAHRLFTEDAKEYLIGQFLPKLSDGKYAAAFFAFAQTVESVAAGSNSMSGLYTDEPYKEPYEPLKWLAIGFGGSLIIGLIVVAVMKGKLKTVHFRSGAAEYIRAGSFCLTTESDRFLYHTVTRTPIPRDTDTGSSGGHSSFGGSSHSTSSGKF